MDKYKGKYRVKSHRKPHWDYSNAGLYFITLVTQNRVCNLGKIIDGEMILSNFGKIVNREWHKSFEIRDELFLDECVIMPNHIHAIIELDTNFVDGDVQTHGRASLRTQNFKREPKSISSFVAGFKSVINSKIDDYIDAFKLDLPKYNKNNHFFQPNYHDHIIRNNRSHQNIAAYIINNPLQWQEDTFNSSISK